MLCKDNVRNKNPKSLQALQAQSVCVHMCVCVLCVCVCVCDEYGVRAIYITMCKCVLAQVYMLYEYSVRNISPKSQQVVQAQSV